MTTRVLMVPHLKHFRSEESGIKRVVEAYFQHLPAHGVQFVEEGGSYDLKAVHAGSDSGPVDICHCHGLYWTADYPADSWEWMVNQQVIDNLRKAKTITVPSEWVAETVRRDMRRRPAVVGHGIDWQAWQHNVPNQGYVLWNKNRKSDVCDPRPLMELAHRRAQTRFVTTFGVGDTPRNVSIIGKVPHDQMQQLVQGAAVYLATVKETFGIGILEAMAAGVPVLGYAHGGILDLVQHGVNGYLAQPGNLDDLIQGLDYCQHHRETLGDNGREMARGWTWEAVAEQVAGIYRDALRDEPASVTVVVPCYNYANRIGRALESVAAQTWREFECIVVDDGSTDGAPDIIPGLLPDRRFRYVRQDNAGVAAARNRGIAEGTGKYVCCLDADDAIDPDFLSRCVAALEDDRALGIAYTALRWIKPDGTTGVSQWPGAWNFDAQITRQNQVPTCCVYRRDMWAALGGYRGRYCPNGAGSEDAEFWTRAGAYGWKAALVSPEPLFVYSWQSGRVSGDKSYREVDWLAWHPWATDGRHPLASYAKAKRFSHPVRQYDEPAVSVIVPVGPGHETDVLNALDSLDAQTFRSWECILAWDTGGPVPEWLRLAFPHARIIETAGRIGAGAARNLAAGMARGPLLLFLDADDWLYPEAIDRMMHAWEGTGAAIYTDYVGKAFIDDVTALAPDLQKRVLHRDEKTGETVLEYHAADYDWQRAQAQPESERPWIWCNVTTLVPRAWHREIGGFDEAMPSWEDYDYWCRVARAGHPFHRIAEPLLVYRFYTGNRRELGREIYADLVAYLTQKYERIPATMCKSCGSRGPSRATPSYATPVQSMATAAAALADSDFVMVDYLHGNRGNHEVWGQAGFDNRLEGLHMKRNGPGGKYRICYGYRSGGERFLVHRRDLDIAPHLFRAVMSNPVMAIEAAPEAPPAPLPIVTPGPEPDALPEPPPAPTLAETARIVPAFDLQSLPGVTPEIAAQMAAANVASRDDVLAMGVAGLSAFRGVGAAKAERILKAVERMRS